ncbi:hypothetical protein D1AOALGA4SA_6774 [Olavius algarvensis Delta 1 endosymbiont]|nr:hypothetical protein D1AOALGA4SA_6774 [Olavius algarvensis Delta 1 endosymbiont]
MRIFTFMRPLYTSSKTVLLRSGFCEVVCEPRHQWQMPKPDNPGNNKLQAPNYK